MNIKLKQQKEFVIPILLYIICFTLSLIMIFFVKTLFLSDELGTFANAAWVSGEEWSKFLSGKLAYYKYGQAMLYVPLFLISDNPIFIYRGALIINALIISFIPVIAYYLVKHAFEIYSIRCKVCIALIIGFFPANILWSKSVINDTMLLTIPWIILLIFYKFFTCQENRKTGTICMLTLALVSAYAYSVHSRGIVIVLASTFTVLWLKVFCNKKRIWPFFAVLTLLLVADYFISTYFKYSIWGQTNLNNTLEYSIEKFDLYKVFSWNGIKNIIRVLAGWLYSITISTLGLFWIGIYGCIIFLHELKCKMELKSYKTCFLIFSILILIGSMGMGILYFSNATYDIVYNHSGNRLDRFIYTRYTACGTGPFLLIGLLTLYEKKISKLLGLIIISSQVITFLGFFLLVEAYYHSGSLSAFMISTCPFILPFSESGLASFTNLHRQFVIIEILIIICILVSLIITWYGKQAITWGMFICGYLAIIINGFYRNHYAYGTYYYSEISCFSDFFESGYIPDDWNKEIYVTDYRLYYVAQFYYGKYCFSTYSEEADNNTNEIIILDNSYFDGKYSNEYVIYPTDIEHHAIAIKGSSLIEYINKMSNDSKNTTLNN